MNQLGQHFLKNKSAIKKIVDSLEIKPGDSIMEIGAGHGELTEVLNQELRSKKQAVQIIAIEKDEVLAKNLEAGSRKQAINNIKIIQGDALKVIPRMLNNSKFMLHVSCFKLVGNIPYYITGRLFRILSELPKKPELCILTIQKEVAERIVAKPPKMNRLAAIVQFWAEPKIISVIPKEDFNPQPKVDSAIVRLKARKMKWRAKVPSLTYHKTVKAIFAQPRKTILNNLLSCAAPKLHKNQAEAERTKKQSLREKIVEGLAELKIDPNSRPQNLDVEDIARISRLIHL